MIRMIEKTLKCLVGASLLTSLVCAQAPLEPLERVAVRADEDGAQFVLKDSGEPFYVTGFNYVRLREGHSTFEAATDLTEAAYEPERAEVMLRTLSESGYNTVRVFVIGRNPKCPGIGGNYDTTQGLYEPYMENVLDFLIRATRHGIRVFPTFGDGGLPRNAYYLDRFKGKPGGKNRYVLTQQGIDARVEWFTSFLTYIKDKEPAVLPTLLGLQCQNEAYLSANQWPFTETEGSLTAANGKTYDLSSSESRQALMDEGYHYYHAQIVAAVRAIDPQMLIAEGVFVPRAVGKDPVRDIGVWQGKVRDERYPPMLTAIGESPLDFLDVHFYRTSTKMTVDEAFRASLDSTGFFSWKMQQIRKEKPLILGEFGAFDHVEQTFAEAVESMVRVRDLALHLGMNGMLFWTLDCLEQERLYHAADDWPLFYQKMGALDRRSADFSIDVFWPSTLQSIGGRVKKVSSYAPGMGPDKMLDGDPSTYWQSGVDSDGAQPPHFVMLEIPRGQRVAGLSYRAYTGGNGNGHVTKCTVYASEDGANWGLPLVEKFRLQAEVDKTQKIRFRRPTAKRYIGMKITDTNGGGGAPIAIIGELDVLLD